MKRPNGTGASGLLNPTGFGSTAAELISTDTVLNCANFSKKTVAKDVWGIDAEGLVVDKDGNFWICEEGGPTIWKLNPNGVVLKRYTPYANLFGAQPEDVLIDSCFKYRKNNRGFEGIALAPNGKIYAIIQSPILYPNKTVGEGTRVHRILEIDPATNAQRMIVYLNDGIIGASGSNQIRLRDWKIGDMAAINDSTFLVLEAALRGTTDIKKVYTININGATSVNSGLYSGVTLEALVDSSGLANNSIKPVKKKLFMNLLSNSWPAILEKAEGLAIINDSTIAICNDNDYGQMASLPDNGIAMATGITGHVFVYSLKGINKLKDYKAPKTVLVPGITGSNSSQSPYILPLTPGASFTSLLTAGDAIGSYKMAGLGDGMGAYDNGNGTFTMLLAHEAGNTAGVVRAHGNTGAFVSKWVINKSNLSIVSGSDLIKDYYLWNGTGYTKYNAASPAVTGFGRFCSADLPAVSAFYNAATGLGTQERIFMCGEEIGSEGRGFAHISTGANAGSTYELPYLGKFSWENSVASPVSSNKTIVAGTDDATPGQVYFYVGTKTNTGSDIDKAGLSNGKLYGVAVAGLTLESSLSIPAANTTFTLVDLGQVQNTTGAALNTASNTAGVTNFLRPEDGAFDPSNPRDFYFVTTNSFTSPSRMWRLRFTDPANPELGGTITAVLDGTEGPKMMDNLTIDNYGHILIQEDPGNQTYLARIWEYTIATDVVVATAEHDATRFSAGGSNYLTQDEESSGIIDVQGILGAGMFLLYDQAHYAVAGEQMEGGQLLSYFNPETFKSNPEVSLSGNSINIIDGDLLPSATDNTDFGRLAGAQTKTFTISNAGPGTLTISDIQFKGLNLSDFSLVNAPVFPLNLLANNNQTITVKFSPNAGGLRTATLNILSNDFDESVFDIALQATVIAPGMTGLSSSQSPYLLPLTPGASFTSLFTAGDVIGSYKLAGLGDGMGAYDNGNGTFTVLLAHEAGNTAGAVRAHGNVGAFVSKWIINKSNLSMVSGSDLIKDYYLWNGTSYTKYNAASPAALGFGRFCSADLPAVSAFYNAATGLGTQERIFMCGEEIGSEGRGFAHISTGANAGSTYELPYLGKFSWENSVASPVSSNKTIVAGTDDATPGQVYFYVGTKTNTGSDIDKAGLSNGKLYGVAVAGLTLESSLSIPAANTTFTLVDLGQVQNTTGAALNTASNTAGVTNFLRPEDGAFDPSNPRDFYFVTTNSFTSPSRMWRLRFTDPANPELGGTITAVLDGTEGPKMMDNLTIDNYGHILIQEDPGNQTYLARIWEYTIATDVVVATAEHDATRFSAGGSNYLTQDEESSGIIDVQGILGAGMFLLYDQAHYAVAGEQMEGGQLLAYYNPETFKSSPEITISGNDEEIKNGDKYPVNYDNTDFGTVVKGSNLVRTFEIKNNAVGTLKIAGISISGVNASEFVLEGLPTFPLTIASGSVQTITVRFTPNSAGLKTAVLNVLSNDFDEAKYSFNIQGLASLSTSIDQLANENGVKLYPNPSNSAAELSMEIKEAGSVSVKVFNVNGQEVMEGFEQTLESGKQSIKMNTANLNAGVYLVEVSINGSISRLKMTVMH